MQAIGIDIGSSSIKGAVLDLATQAVHAPVSRPFPAPIGSLARARVEIDPKATVKRPNGARTPFTQDDITRVLERSARNADGTYRASAGRLLPGKVIGSFRYQGTRSDDPNDLVPHQQRR